MSMSGIVVSSQVVKGNFADFNSECYGENYSVVVKDLTSLGVVVRLSVINTDIVEEDLINGDEYAGTITTNYRNIIPNFSFDAGKTWHSINLNCFNSDKAIQDFANELASGINSDQVQFVDLFLSDVFSGDFAGEDQFNEDGELESTVLYECTGDCYGDIYDNIKDNVDQFFDNYPEYN